MNGNAKRVYVRGAETRAGLPAGLPQQQAFGQGRTLVRQVGLGPDKIDLAFEASGAHGANSGSRRLPRAGDDNPLVRAHRHCDIARG